MPINYPDGIIKESNFVRDDAGMFDVSIWEEWKFRKEF
ncbi:MAG: hypothetical protein Ct9H90mP2_06810 [Dehalococcoidia bacterium]|nr:MAG: hypothetical protein Ct9H90mP2_06810 [Dehalococcoidia bacterium]